MKLKGYIWDINVLFSTRIQIKLFLMVSDKTVRIQGKNTLFLNKASIKCPQEGAQGLDIVFLSFYYINISLYKHTKSANLV